MNYKIIIGTANLSSRYGLLKNNLDENNFHKCLKLLKKKKSKFIETSLEYKKAINILKKSNLKKFNIILKIKFNRKINYKNIYDLRRKFKIKNFYCIMIHNPEILFHKKNKNILSLLRKFKEDNICKKVGISLYSFRHISKILKLFKFDIVQVPFNIFDQRLIDKKIFKILVKNNIIIHVRSIFLQGLLLKQKHKLSNKKEFYNFNKLVEKSKNSRLFHCINFIKNHTFVRNLVIGINSYQDLKEIFKNISRKKRVKNYSKFKSVKYNIINPYTW